MRPVWSGKKEARIICISVQFRPIFRHLRSVFSITEDHATSVWIWTGVACLRLTLTCYVSCKWKQIKMHFSHYIKSPPSCVSFLSENIFSSKFVIGRNSLNPAILLVPWADGFSRSFRYTRAELRRDELCNGFFKNLYSHILVKTLLHCYQRHYLTVPHQIQS